MGKLFTYPDIERYMKDTCVFCDEQMPTMTKAANYLATIRFGHYHDQRRGFRDVLYATQLPLVAFTITPLFREQDVKDKYSSIIADKTVKNLDSKIGMLESKHRKVAQDAIISLELEQNEGYLCDIIDVITLSDLRTIQDSYKWTRHPHDKEMYYPEGIKCHEECWPFEGESKLKWIDIYSAISRNKRMKQPTLILAETDYNFSIDYEHVSAKQAIDQAEIFCKKIRSYREYESLDHIHKEDRWRTT